MFNHPTILLGNCMGLLFLLKDIFTQSKNKILFFFFKLSNTSFCKTHTNNAIFHTFGYLQRVNSYTRLCKLQAVNQSVIMSRLTAPMGQIYIRLIKVLKAQKSQQQFIDHYFLSYSLRLLPE